MSWISSVAYSPDATNLTCGSFHGSITLWNTDTWEEVKTITGHTSTVKALSYSPDGRILASCGGDGKVRIWSSSLYE